MQSYQILSPGVGILDKSFNHFVNFCRQNPQGLVQFFRQSHQGWGQFLFKLPRGSGKGYGGLELNDPLK